VALVPNSLTLGQAASPAVYKTLEKTGELLRNMNKIALATVLAIGALGIGCGDATSNNANNSNANRTNINTATPAPTMARPLHRRPI